MFEKFQISFKNLNITCSFYVKLQLLIQTCLHDFTEQAIRVQRRMPVLSSCPLCNQRQTFVELSSLVRVVTSEFSSV